MSQRSAHQRVEEALQLGEISIAELARRVYPPADYPRTWRRPAQGGPYACYLLLIAMLHRMGCEVEDADRGRIGERVVRLPKQ